ncbi:zinc finger protein 37-like isoform X2 [Ischnura elegans]|uniref:zinc finger protein 37-like isoform X2 n=1 Tax=Ischnura elegans TaxID=197161 RepID=UPI001ED8B5C2|nr:zinc finger protein 37-like isoform X2 [Ischnura elegans]
MLVAGSEVVFVFRSISSIANLEGSVKVRKVGNYPWLACSTCLEKLIDFKLFKSRCIDSNITFEKRFCQGTIEDASENILEMPNADEITEGGDGSNEEGADVSKMCQALTGVKAVTSDWHDYDEGNPNVILYPCKREFQDSSEGNLEDQEEGIDIEEGQRLDIKEEPQEFRVDESSYPPEVPGMSSFDPVTGATCSNRPVQRESTERESVSRVKVRQRKRKQSLGGIAGEDSAVGEGFYCVFCSAVLSTEKNLRDHIAEHEEGRLKHRQTQQQLSKENTAGKVVFMNPINASAKGCGGPSKRKTGVNSLPLSLVTPHYGYDSCKKRGRKCLKDFRSLAAFEAHKSNNCKSKFKCTRCNKYFGTQSSLTGHLKATNASKSSCKACSLFFSYRCELRAHRREVHTKVFMCKDCHCSFDRYYHLREHLLTHCKVKPLVCKDCQQTFIGTSALRKHRTEAHNGRGDQTSKESSVTT